MNKLPALLALAAVIGGLAGFALGWKSPRRDVPAAPAPVTSRTDTREVSAPTKGTSDEAGENTSAKRVPASPETVGLAPKKRFLSLAFQRWSTKARQQALRELFLSNPEAQKRLFEHLMTTTNFGDLEAGQDFLIGTQDSDLVRRMADAFASETNPDRRAMLAYALGGNARQAEARPGIEQALDAQDETLLKRVLTRLTLANLKDSPDATLRIEARLKTIVGSGMSQDVRVAAVRSLMGGASDDRTRYLLDLALRDSDPAIQRAAVNSLPIQFMSNPPLLEEQVGGLWMLARDESREGRVRQSAASLLWDHARFNRVKLSDADQALLKALVDSKK